MSSVGFSVSPGGLAATEQALAASRTAVTTALWQRARSKTPGDRTPDSLESEEQEANIRRAQEDKAKEVSTAADFDQSLTEPFLLCDKMSCSHKLPQQTTKEQTLKFCRLVARCPQTELVLAPVNLFQTKSSGR